MLKQFFLAVFVVGLTINLTAQDNSKLQEEPKNHLSVGFGYFNDIFWLESAKEIFINGGTAVRIHGARMLKTGYYINASIAFANRNYDLDQRWDVFEGANNNEYYGLWCVGISKPFKVKGRHSVEPSLGLVYRQWWRLSPDLWYQNGVQYIDLGTDMVHELGLQFSISYQYGFSNGFYIGGMASSYYLWGIGIEGLTLSPVFGVRF
ncbi:MAG: hypothetical protein RBT19_02655 [Tenuifilaceae bacterium]|jgi:hypothetical protein|nr:hypothetical protein [Tenuifilaceae bacterium]